jgi:hypothetical protein
MQNELKIDYIIDIKIARAQDDIPFSFPIIPRTACLKKLARNLTLFGKD